MNCLIKQKKSIATALLTIFYCQTILAAYQPWRHDTYSHVVYYVSNPIYKAEKAALSPYSIESPAGADMNSGEEKEAPQTQGNLADFGEDIGGPTQPEMSSFKSVNSNNMVDLFSGDFSYNIPLLDVGGYPINLFYKSGITMDQEASWVGLGWNINPGTITRNLRGVPDDFDGNNDIIQKTTSIAPSKTIGADVGADIEIFGLSNIGVEVGLSLGVFHNTYRGWGLQSGVHATISSGFASMGSLSGGLSIVNNSQEGLTLSPSLSAGLSKGFSDDNNAYSGAVSIGGGFSYNSRSGLVSNLSTGINLSHDQVDKSNHMDHISGSTLYSSGISFASPSYNPTADIPFTNNQFTFMGKIGGELYGVHPSAYVKGYISKQYIASDDIKRIFPAYGYLHYEDANDNPQALLDFNREKDIVYREKPAVPNIAVPSYTYDLFCINGEGTGGMFRAYRGDIGFVHDPYVTTKSSTGSAGVDVGFGNLFHGGVDINVNHAVTTTGPWIEGNPLASTVKFKQSDSVFEAAYFRNPGEKSINPASFYKSIGDDDVVTAQLYQVSNGPSITSTNYLQRWRNKASTNVSTLLNSATDFKTKRDKRTQVISYLTAAEASHVGLDTVIYNYNLNQWAPAGCSTNVIKPEARVNDFRQPNHISEIDVLNNDGRRYVYGLPVYNLKQVEATFAADSVKNNKKTGLVKIVANDTTQTKNHHGKDNYFQKQITSPYAHSFLLTSILTPDYVDVTGNGVSEDDLGDAIKFNYTKVAGKDSAFKWRAPYVKDSATYNEGLQTYVRDDKGSYIYGEKEVWYLNSVESKNMIAIFVLQKRTDLRPIDEMGHIATGAGDTVRSKCLKEINLYSKSDYIKNGLNAKPIKTVHFAYTNELCKGLNGGASDGKLTLKRLWFTYNGNRKGTKNPYLFFYNNNNPNYTNTAYDRWGNYKDPLNNPRSTKNRLITNAEYPYALQDSVLANKNAAAWTMDSLILPSSGSIKVGYESDDYAYVQNKRAMQMFNVVGLSHDVPSTFYSGSAGNNVSNLLYRPNSEGESPDNLYVAIRVTNQVSNAKEFYQKYLEGFTKVYFKLNVQMPTDQWGSGYEYLPVYADIDVSSIADSSKYGILSIPNNIVWIKLQGISLAGDSQGDYSPLAKAAIQFLRLNLPSKAYPGSEVSDNLDFETAVQMLAAMGSNIVNAFSNFDVQARSSQWAIRIDTAKSVARLNNPIYKKYGGGLRVKFIRIYDNWKKMTSSQENQAVYGQVYDYSTIKNINGTDTKISSGVASWEPMMGGEENPFRVPLEYADRPALLAPVTMGYTEVPLGESFFPGASVGYSQVRVRSIHSNNIKSATGYEETKFYTAYDFPVITDNSLLTPDTKKRYKTNLSDFLRIKSYHYLSMSQGFKVELNDMNGKVKSQASYAETDSMHPIASSTYYYHVDDQNAEFKHLNNTVKVVNQQGEIDSTAIIGKDIELMMDMREQHSLTQGADYGVNVDVFVIAVFPIPVPSYIPMPQKEETRFRSVATTKIIQRFGILDSVVAVDKGSKVSTDNLVYDSETGDVLLTRTRNEFDDTVYNFTYPAHWAYSGMGPAYQNINAVYNSGNSTNIKIVDGVLQSTAAYPGMINRFESGDEILAVGKPKTGETVPQDCSGQSSCPTPIFSSTPSAAKLWAVDSKKIDPASTLGIVFIDKEGNPYSAESVSLKVIRSGHRNLAQTVVGTVAALKNPLRKVSGKLKVVIDSSIEILNTTAGVFNERWKIKDVMYLKDTSTDNLFNATLYPSAISIKEYNWVDGGSSGENFYSNAQYIGASFDTTGTDDGDGFGSCHRKVVKNKTILQYNFSSIPIGASVQNASISFTPKTPGTDFCNFRYTASDHDCETKDWSSSTTYYDGESSASLKRITAPWSSTTPYSNFATTDVHKITVTQSAYTNISCKDLVQDVLANTISRTYGLEFVISNESSNSNAHTLKYLTFNGSSSNPPLNIQYTLVNNFGVCRSAVTQRNINPYTCGVLGNWRGEESLVYYTSRAESDVNVPVNIRKNGTIKNFKSYWNFTAEYLSSNPDTTNWVWNSKSTLYNKKGFEIENKDPLGRYNAGDYGYNESLPVAVVQNGRFKDQFFDGLEDYDYSTQSCTQDCPVPRNIDFTLNGDSLTALYAHSGKFSLKIGAHDSSFQTFPIVAANYNDPQKVKLLIDSSGIDTTVTPIGNGLLTNVSGGNVIRYYGFIQAETSGYYTVRSVISHESYPSGGKGYVLNINGVYDDVQDDFSTQIDVTVFLLAGQKTNISIDCHSGSYFTGDLALYWKKIGCSSVFTVIPTTNRYQTNTADNSVAYGPPSCSGLRGITTDSSTLLPSFKPSQGQPMVLSAWVKEEQDCLCDQYNSNQVNLTFGLPNSGKSVLSFRPSGNIVEGWQRYEAVFTVPVNAVSMRVSLVSTGSTPVYFDDIRMHPYNANMKSFVYDPVSLRLMAELDENNYATFYEYDDDGTLIRVKKETEKGVQTVKETRSALSGLNDQ